jgi:NAD-dependent dihydropyrimidine dehydrogenase PreA subunit
MWADVAMRCNGCGCSFLTTAEEAEAMKGISWLRTLDIMKVCQRWACCVRCMLCAQSKHTMSVPVLHCGAQA